MLNFHQFFADTGQVPNYDYTAEPVYSFTFLSGEEFPQPPYEVINITDDTVVEPEQGIRLEFTIESTVDPIFLGTTGLTMRITDNDGQPCNI